MKQYIQPAIKVVNIHAASPMLDGSPYAPGLDRNNTYSGDGTNLSTGRRGSWGSLWYDGSDEE